MLAHQSGMHFYLLEDASQGFRECVIKDYLCCRINLNVQFNLSLMYINLKWASSMSQFRVLFVLSAMKEGLWPAMRDLCFLLFSDIAGAILWICSLVWCTIVKEGCRETVEGPASMFRGVWPVRRDWGSWVLTLQRWVKGNLIVTYSHLSSNRWQKKGQQPQVLAWEVFDNRVNFTRIVVHPWDSLQF